MKNANKITHTQRCLALPIGAVRMESQFSMRMPELNEISIFFSNRRKMVFRYLPCWQFNVNLVNSWHLALRPNSWNHNCVHNWMCDIEEVIRRCEWRNCNVSEVSPNDICFHAFVQWVVSANSMHNGVSMNRIGWLLTLVIDIRSDLIETSNICFGLRTIIFLLFITAAVGWRAIKADLKKPQTRRFPICIHSFVLHVLKLINFVARVTLEEQNHVSWNVVGLSEIIFEKTQWILHIEHRRNQSDRL